MPAKTAAREGIIAVGTPGSSSRSGGAMPNGGLRTMLLLHTLAARVCCACCLCQRSPTKIGFVS